MNTIIESIKSMNESVRKMRRDLKIVLVEVILLVLILLLGIGLVIAEVLK